jgi:hypothetical protein
MKKRQLPDLHLQAMKFKNRKRLQHDGGRAWIKDSQLHDAIRGMGKRFETVKMKVDEEPEASVQGH